MSENLEIAVSGNATGAVAALNSVKDKVKELHEQGAAHVEALTSGFGKLQEAMLAIAAIAAGGALFKEMINSTLETTGAVTRLQKSFGMTLAEANQTKSALDLLGVSTETYVEMATKLDRQLKAGSESLTKMGLTAKDLDLGQKGLMDKAIAKLAEYKEGVDRNIAAQVLFGRGGAEAVKLVRLSLEGVTEKAKELEEAMHLTVTPQDQANARNYKLVMSELGMAFEGIKKAIGDAVLPYLTKFTEWFVDKAPTLIAGMKSGMATVVEAGFNAAEGFLNFVVKVMGGVGQLYSVWLAIKEKFGGITADEAFASADAFDRTFNKLEKFRDDAVAVLRDLKKKVLENRPFDTSNLELGKVEKGSKSATGLLDDGQSAKDRISAALLAAKGEVDAAKEALAQKTAILDLEVSLGKITQDKKFALLQGYTEQAYQEELKVLQNELNISGITLAQQQQIFNKIRALKAQHVTEMINLDRQSIQAQVTMWKQYTDTIAGSFNSQLRGIITGQTSFSQAMKNILLDLSLKTVELIATKPASEYIAAKLAMLTATQTGAAAQAASEVAGAEAALPAKIASFTSDLTARAALTFAGIFANLSPLMGPLAAGPAAAGEASVLAQAVAVPKFELGSWSVPQTGSATVHRGEFIARAGAEADAARNAVTGGDSGGGGTVHNHYWNIQTMDGANLGGFLKSGGGAMIAKYVSGYQDKNPSARNRR